MSDGGKEGTKYASNSRTGGGGTGMAMGIAGMQDAANRQDKGGYTYHPGIKYSAEMKGKYAKRNGDEARTQNLDRDSHAGVSKASAGLPELGRSEAASFKVRQSRYQLGWSLGTQDRRVDIRRGRGIQHASKAAKPEGRGLPLWAPTWQAQISEPTEVEEGDGGMVMDDWNDAEGDAEARARTAVRRACSRGQLPLDLQNPFSPSRVNASLVPAQNINAGIDGSPRRLMTFRRTAISARRSRRELLRLIGRIDQPRRRIRALVAKRRAFKCDGPGLVYITSRVPYWKLNAYLQGHIQISEFLDALEVKVGHTSSMRRRQREYRVCANGIAIRWHVAFRARKRILSEAIAHLLLRDMGAVPSVFPCPGCGVSHREYVPFRSVGSFDALERVVREAIRKTGQLVAKKILLYILNVLPSA
ncbi:hypothetical protein B0H11DRAFT_1912608 [Mycena galericulata]|nr:hypothetical protein B0H11DRAFT_1912608 [Mycena galericulata]